MDIDHVEVGAAPGGGVDLVARHRTLTGNCVAIHTSARRSASRTIAVMVSRLTPCPLTSRTQVWMPRSLACPASHSVKTCRSSTGVTRAAGAVGVTASTSARRAWSRHAYTVGRDTPLSRLIRLMTPYPPACASIWLLHCARCAGVLPCVRTIGSSLVV